MVAFTVGDPEKSLLKNWIALVPKSESKTEALFVVTNAAEPIFPPTISPRARLVVAEVVPRITVSTVILAYCSPLPFAEVWSPFFPGNALLASFIQPALGRSVETGFR
jgi:hypothetical protein